MADAAGSKPIVAAQLASDGIAIQTGDTRHQGDATVALLLCQQADQSATTAPINQATNRLRARCCRAVLLYGWPLQPAHPQQCGSFLSISRLIGVPLLVSWPERLFDCYSTRTCRGYFCAGTKRINDSIFIFDMDRLAETPFLLGAPRVNACGAITQAEAVRQAIVMRIYV